MPPAPGSADPISAASGLLSYGPLVLHGQKRVSVCKRYYQSLSPVPYGGATWPVAISAACVTM